jgi:hypothetical protein
MFAKGWCSQFIAKQTLMWVAAKIGVPQFPAIFLQRSNRQKGLEAADPCGALSSHLMRWSHFVGQFGSEVKVYSGV